MERNAIIIINEISEFKKINKKLGKSIGKGKVI
jgi:hypothetical protein